jgi:hypothetical protein
MAETSHTVAEMQGLYGPFTVAERVVQKIWLQQEFTVAQARLVDGRSVQVVSPGRWNLLGGPDFKDARLLIDGRETTGDVEVHFHAADWTAHGHAANPEYAQVALHVLLFPPAPGARLQRRSDGVEIPALVLLPLLHRDLEEYAADEALERLTSRDDWRAVEELANLPLGERRVVLGELARARWRRKVAHAQQRVDQLGWSAAAHHTALEILGYRSNRLPMLAAAERFPLVQWSRADTALAALRGIPGWQRQGVRPANRPSSRLDQYHRWVRAAPDWPRQLESLCAHLAEPARETIESTTAPVRRRAGYASWRSDFVQLTAGAVGGPRLDTLVCDGFLPLGATRRGADRLFPYWFNWFPGDMPDQIRAALPRLGLAGGPGEPLCHGLAQGLLAWLMERAIRT